MNIMGELFGPMGAAIGLNTGIGRNINSMLEGIPRPPARDIPGTNATSLIPDEDANFASARQIPLPEVTQPEVTPIPTSSPLLSSAQNIIMPERSTLSSGGDSPLRREIANRLKLQKNPF
jgi:hypothetical protein